MEGSEYFNTYRADALKLISGYKPFNFAKNIRKNTYNLFENMHFFNIEDNKKLYLERPDEGIYKTIEDAKGVCVKTAILSKEELDFSVESLVDTSIIEEINKQKGIYT